VSWRRERKFDHFEMMGDRALYQDGWIASTKVMRLACQECSSTSAYTGAAPRR
jgi:hypothetical protein